MNDRFYVAVQYEGPRARIIHVSIPFANPVNTWVARSGLQPEMPTLVHQLFAAHPAIQQIYLGTHYIGCLIAEGAWTVHLKDILIDLIVDDQGLDYHLMTESSYDDYKVLAPLPFHSLALADDELFELI